MTGDQIVGWVAVVVGLLGLANYGALALGRPLPARFWKLGHMQARWGRVAGTLVHFVAYVLVPLAVGMAFLTGRITL